MSSVGFRARHSLHACPLCGGTDLRAVTQVGGHPVVRCRQCTLQFANPQASDAELAAIYGPDYILAPDGSTLHGNIVASKRATADHYLDLLARHGARGGRLLEVGCGAGNFLLQAAQRGFDITGVEYSPFACQRARDTLGGRGRIVQGEIDALAGESAAYDVVVMCDVIEHVRDPGAFLRHAHRLLRPGGALIVVTPSLDSWSARLMGARWMERKPEHLFYFSRRTIVAQLAAAGFSETKLHPGTKRLSLDYIAAHFEKYPVPGVVHALRLFRALTPARLRTRLFPIVASGLVAIAQKPLRPAP